MWIPFVSHLIDLYWLDIEEKVLSGNRGVAKRIKQGIFLQSFPSVETSSIKLSVIWDKLEVIWY